MKNFTDNPKTLGEFPIGARLLVRTKKDWRVAVVSQFDTQKATLIICSPAGRTYRVRRCLKSIIVYDGGIPLLKIETAENWRENFTRYD
ncbi:MAG: hypothetical protein H0T08_00315, partial [Acidobacteria bacterium]|nr:hypothetical protein [Acidobacteriota bacterium]